MITLQIDRPPPRHIAKQGTTGTPHDRLIVDDQLTIQDHRDVAIGQRDVIALPLAARQTRVLSWFDTAKDRAGAVDSLHRAVSIDNLCLVQSANVNPAVALAGDVEFDVQTTITKNLLTTKIAKLTIRAEICFGRLIDQLAVFHTPAVTGSGGLQFPAREVATVEQFNLRSEFDGVQIGPRRQRR